MIVSSLLPGHPPTAVLDLQSDSAWYPIASDSASWLTIDFRELCDYGALVLNILL